MNRVNESEWMNETVTHSEFRPDLNREGTLPVPIFLFLRANLRAAGLVRRCTPSWATAKFLCQIRLADA